ncbi:MAG: hercynine metabolism protein [Cyanobium sp.]
MSGASWLEELEARLEQQLEAFLRANPQQEALLAEQEQRERQQRLLGQRLQLRQEAELQRQGLLQLATEIRQWKQRVERARRAGADELAGRAEAHIATLMEQGRGRWQSLAELGERFQAVEQELQQLTARRASAGAAPKPEPGSGSGSTAAPAAAPASADPRIDLERAWASFETQQELDELRRRSGR